MHKRGLSQIVSTILLVVLVIAAFVAVYALYQNLMNGATGGYNVTNDNSVLTVNPAGAGGTGTGMLLLVLNNHGPSAINIYNITIVDQNGNNIIIQPLNNTRAELECVQASDTACTLGSPPITTGQIVGGASVGMGGVAPNRFLSVPSGRQVSIQFNIQGNIIGSFSAGAQYQVLIRPSNGPLVYLTLTATSQ